MKHYVYIYLNPLKPGKFNYGKFEFNYQPFYVGKGFNNRINIHIKEAKQIIENDIEPTGNKHKLNTIIKIINNGFEPIRVKLYENITNESACRVEKYLISLIGRNDLHKGPLTNMTDGGEGLIGYKMSEDSKHKNSISQRLRWQNGYYNNLNLFGQNNPFYGKTHSEKNKRIFSETAKKTFTGRKQTDEHKKKKADAIRGEKNGMYGTNIYKKWVEKFGKQEADKKYKEFIENNRIGKNNPMYGKKDGNHPANKLITLIFPDAKKLQFKGHKQCKSYLENTNIIKDGFSYNSLRQYSKKNKKYQGYFLLIE